MKKNVTFLAGIVLALSFIAMQGCNFSTANLSSLKTSTDKDAKTEATSFKTGETLYGKAQVSNNPGKVKVKFYLVAEDVKGLAKGDTLKGSDVSVDIDGDAVASYSVPVTPGFLAGTYKLNADMLNEAGEKKDSKTANITVTQTAAAMKPETSLNTDDKSDKDDKDDDKDDK